MKRPSLFIWILFAIALGALLAAMMNSYVVKKELNESFEVLRQEQQLQLQEQSSKMRSSIIGELETKYEDDIASYKKAEKEALTIRRERQSLEAQLKEEEAVVEKPFE